MNELLTRLLQEIEAGTLTKAEAIQALIDAGANEIDAQELIDPRPDDVPVDEMSVMLFENLRITKRP